jgi:hypothetical protein
VHNTGIGLTIEEDILKTDENNVIVSHRYHNQLENEDDLEKFQLPEIRHDEKASENNYQAYREIFDGILTVKKRGAPGFWFAPWDDIVRLIGAQEVLLQLASRPGFIHKVVDRIVTAYLHALDQYEAQNLLALNDTNVRIGSGAYGYTDELPPKGFDVSHVRTHDMWGAAAAQIFSGVSTQMHKEFAIDYERRWLDRFQLTYYGCCEPLADKIELLRTIPNLRKISVSPWNDYEKAASRIAGDFVFSLKPSPAVFARDGWNLDLARQELVNALRCAQKHGCSVEIIIKDISTVHHEPQRLWEWALMAAEITKRFAT